MNMKKQYLILILVFLFLILGTTISYGAYSASSATVQSEGTITVNVTSTEELDAYNLDLKSYDGLTFNSCSKTENGAIININGSSIGYMNMSGKTKDLGTYSFTAPKVTEDKTYIITFLIDKKTTVKSTIKVEAPPPVETKPETPTTNTQTPTTTTPPPTTVTKSSEARLKNFGITPNDFSGFKRDKLEYSTTVPNDVAEVEIYAEKLDSKATIEGTGKVSLKEGNNTFEVKVTAEDGKTTKTYKLTIKRKTAAEQATENAEARLKNLGIKPEEYDFTGFNREKTEYSAEVPNEVSEIEVYATAMNSSAQITGIGMIDLKEGVNELPIEVIAADGTKRTYTLTVTRKEAEKKEKFGLSILNVQGFNLNPKFDAEIYEYTIDLNKDIDSLEIGTRPTDDEATVEILGNENLQQGENVITILVKNEETEEVATYQIIVTKNAKTVVGTVTTPKAPQKSWLKPETWGKEEIIKLAIILVLILLIICAIILKINISKESPKNKSVDLPGADELDKAIAEHQELVEEPNYETEENYIEEIAISRFGDEKEDNATKRRGRHF